MADSCQCMTKPTAMLWNGWPPTNETKWKKKKIEKTWEDTCLSSNTEKIHNKIVPLIRLARWKYW